MKITKKQLKKIIKEELGVGGSTPRRTLKQVGREKREKAGMPPHPRYAEEEGKYPERGSQDEAQYEVMRQMGLFLAKLIKQGNDELADEFDRILAQAEKAGMKGRKGW